MGCCSSKPRFDDHADEATVDKVRQLCYLSDAHIDRLYKEFKRFDMDNSGVLSVHEFFAVADIEYTTFNLKVFTLLDLDHSEHLTFVEFLATAAYFMTLDPGHIGSFAFELYDSNDSGALGATEIRRMMRDIFGPDWEQNNAQARQVDKALERTLQGKPDHCFPASEWQEFLRRHAFLVFPVIELHEHLRKQILGEKFWREASRYRESINPRREPFRVFAQKVLSVYKRAEQHTEIAIKRSGSRDPKDNPHARHKHRHGKAQVAPHDQSPQDTREKELERLEKYATGHGQTRFSTHHNAGVESAALAAREHAEGHERRSDAGDDGDGEGHHHRRRSQHNDDDGGGHGRHRDDHGPGHGHRDDHGQGHGHRDDHDHGHGHREDHGHGHGHGSGHGHGHGHGHRDDHGHGHGHGHGHAEPHKRSSVDKYRL